jgi:hypothetical protein
VAIWDPYDSTITIDFASPIAAVGIWYTSLDPLELDAFDILSNPLGSVVGDANTDGSIGTSSFLYVVASGIQTIDLTGSAGQFVSDDLATDGDVVPEPNSFVLAMPVALLLLSRLLRRKIPG